MLQNMSFYVILFHVISCLLFLTVVVVHPFYTSNRSYIARIKVRLSSTLHPIFFPRYNEVCVHLGFSRTNISDIDPALAMKNLRFMFSFYDEEYQSSPTSYGMDKRQHRIQLLIPCNFNHSSLLFRSLLDKIMQDKQMQ